MCPNCNAPVRGESEYCTNCGAPVRPPSAPGSGNAPVTQPAPPRAPAPGWPGQVRRPATGQFRLALKRLAAPDLIIGGATVVAFLSLFLPWFGLFGSTISGMSLHGYLVIALLAQLALLGYLVLRAGWDTPPVRFPIAHAPLLLIGTGVQLLFVFIAFLQPDGLSHEFGSYLDLLASLVACGVIAVPVIRSVLAAQQGRTG